MRRRVRGRPFALVALACAVLTVQAARAEGPTHSMSVWRIHGDEADVRAWVPIALARRFGASGEAGSPAAAESFARAGLLTGDYLARHLVLSTVSGPCAPVAGGPTNGSVDGDWIVHAWKVRCAGGGGWRLRDDAFFEDAPSHAHLARVSIEGREPRERVLTTGERVFAIGARESAGAVALAVERARRVAPLAMALTAAVLASGWMGGSPRRRALAAVLGLSVGALVPAPRGLGVDVAGLALLGVVVAAMARERSARGFGQVLLVAGVAAIGARAASAPLGVALGVALIAGSSSCGRPDLAVVEAVAGLVVAVTANAEGAATASPGERLLSACAIALPLVGCTYAARSLARPRWIPSALAAAVVAVTVAWIGVGPR